MRRSVVKNSLSGHFMESGLRTPGLVINPISLNRAGTRFINNSDPTPIAPSHIKVIVNYFSRVLFNYLNSKAGLPCLLF